ncbi:MAG: phage tail tube protein, partial [Patescibacteria group bacterium]|nr:phage tail tube protein [Patescibacteria group bacterium]
MVKTIGPAVGSKGQVGFVEECKWGYPASPPDSFVEFTGEGIVSEYTNLVSGALRADRAVHKQRLGSESAGGDVNFELCPEGFGTLLKHALGKKRTKRKDVAFIMVYDGTATDMIVSVTASGVFATGTSDTFAIYFGATETVQDVITAINAESNWSCYAPWGDGSTGYFPNSTKSDATSTLGASDYDSSAYAKTGGVCNLEIITEIYCDEDKGEDKLIFFPINFKYGIYEHTLDADADLPQGLSFEIGRDVAAFNYYGGRINSLALTINPGEFITGTANIMFKGASTCGDVSANSANTGWKIPYCGISYAGDEDSAKVQLDTDGTKEHFYFEHGGSGTEVPTYGFSLERGYYSHDGYYWEVTTMAGLLELLEYETDYFSVTRKGGISAIDTTIGLDAQTLVAMSADSDTVLYKDTDASASPLVRGNYIGVDAGTSVLLTVKISTGGAMGGTAKFQSQKTGDAASWCTAQTITADT